MQSSTALWLLGDDE